MTALGESPVWSVLLPDDAIRLPDRRLGVARRFSVVTPVPQDRYWTMTTSPWTGASREERVTCSDAQVVHSYVTYPRDAPVLVASKDEAVLRYVTTCVLSVPPGAGRIASMIFMSGLRLLRFPMMWICAAVVRAAGVVLIGEWR
jgi:hypothetical protein